LYFQILVAIQRATLKLQNLAVLMALVLFSSNAAASFQTNELLQARIRLFEAWVANVMDEQALKGLSVSLVQDQQVVYTQGFGFADVENQNRTTADTTYRIGSVTKLFTSIALMQLVEAEKLSLDTPVIELVPELEAIQANGYALDEITIRSILTHTTGLPTNPNFILDKQAVFEPLVRHAFLQKLPGQRLLFQPNRTHKYSNLGMNLGGLIVERLTNLTYEQYLQEFVLAPLEMDKSGFPGEMDESQVVGYSRMLGGIRVGGDFPEMSRILGLPASGLLSSASDLAKFLSWHFRTLSGDDETLLSLKTLAQMQQVQWVPLPIEQNPAMASIATFISNSLELGGTGFGYFRNKEFVMHGGGLMGFTAEFLMNNHNKLGIVALANSIDAPLSFNHPQSLTKNLYDMVGAVAAAPVSANTKLRYAEYESVYSDGHNWSYYATEIDGKLVLLNLRDGSPLAEPAILTKVGEDRFVDLNHQGFYSGEFSVEFHRGASGEVDAVIVNTEKLYRRN